MVYTLKVPLDRVGVIIGTKGGTLRLLKERSGAQIEVDSETGEVILHEEGAKDPYLAYRMRDVLRALGRGFSPEHSLLLLKDDMYYEEFDIKDFSGKSRKRGEQVRSRLIGSDGRTRKLVEELTECLVSIKGNTVGIIGDLEGVKVASKAIELLLSGSEHSTVYSFMERKQRDLRTARSGF
ncbi:MAG: KH domain-containing protein [Candidatus Thermoplasmatota archaeon]|jgi:ribosomal RNA assembly protein|nr:KH domain-containing protein [Candidatus Thermoplasmatota archaeon]